MASVKLRKVGDSTVLTVPKTIKPRFSNYEAFSGRDGAIVFLPKEPNPFTDENFIRTHLDSLTEESTTKAELINHEF
ncbi:hypothetical protein [Levilactobacillus koreensis]|uniref:AbrB family transcriptional regulator n=1 Tax=Levilactobacillus koreensis TaxID=637971 RepID=A0AAC9ER50_9LACO|nr:hypothetical protein [Levilactobacillus koreensis]AKP64094.1 hypothetical protein ABN16_03155 [Levilactobacillus koreensis]